MLRLLLLSSVVSAHGQGVVKKPIVVPGWPKLPYPFETGIVTCTGMNGCLMHVSGLPGVDFTANPPAIVKGGIKNETMQALTNIATVAKAAGSSMDNFMECTAFISTSAPSTAFEDMNSVYKTFFGAVKPTRAAVYVKLVGTALVEIKCSGFAPAPTSQTSDANTVQMQVA